MILVLLIQAILTVVGSATDPAQSWSWSNQTQPISIFRSRPDLLAPILRNVEGFSADIDRMSPGYFFVAPYANIQEAFYIYDNYLELVYSGFGAFGGGQFHNPQVCQYNAEDHICMFQGVQHTGWSHGHGLIIDNHYRVIQDVQPTGDYASTSDMHEFRLSWRIDPRTGENITTALMTQFSRSVADLCNAEFGLCDGLGYVNSGVVQEIDIKTGEAVFTWNSLDHLYFDESQVLPSSTEISGSGESPQSPWDWVHINSIDKSSFDQSYLISGRHTSAIYKISKSGHLVWRLGGTRSDYLLVNDLQFSFQHDARIISDKEDETIISIFNNGGNGYTQPEPHSSALIISVNHITKIASLIQRIEPPIVDGHQHISHSQGNFQRLPNGNTAIGWGNDPYLTEYASNGDVVFYGQLAEGEMMNYRAQKFPWIGKPLTKPALWTYSQHGLDNFKNNNNENENVMMCYVSWNGATEVSSWSFYGSNDLGSAKHWTELAPRFAKNGFETIFRHTQTFEYVYAEAFDVDGNSLGKSVTQKTFVPSKYMRDRYCDELACYFMPTNDLDREEQRERMRLMNISSGPSGARYEDGEKDGQEDGTEGSLVSSNNRNKVGWVWTCGLLSMGIALLIVVWKIMGRSESIQVLIDKILVVVTSKTRLGQIDAKGRYASLTRKEDEESNSYTDGRDDVRLGTVDEGWKAL